MIELKSIQIENIMPFVSGVVALDALDYYDQKFVPFVVHSLLKPASENTKKTLKERIADVSHSASQQFLQEAMKSPYASEHEGAFRNVINLVDSSQEIIDNGVHATNEIAFMQAASNHDLLDVEGVSFDVLEKKLPEDRRGALVSALEKIRELEMLSVLSHIFMGEYNYRVVYQESRKNKAASEELLSLASSLASSDFNLLEFLYDNPFPKIHAKAFELMDGDVQPAAQLFFDAKKSQDFVTMKHAVADFNRIHRKAIHAVPELDEEVSLDRDRATILANRFYYIREYAKDVWGKSDEEK